MNRLAEVLARLSTGRSSEERITPDQFTARKAEYYNSVVGILNEEDGFRCDTCKNKGIIMDVEKSGSGWITVTKPCQCSTIRQAIRRMRKSGLRNVIEDYTFDKFEASEPWQKRMKEDAERYANNPKGFFFLGGQSGCGKTHLCTSIFRKLLLDGKNARYMMWVEDSTRLKRMVTELSYHSEVEELKRVDVLYIDDLFKGSRNENGYMPEPSEADKKLAFDILNARKINPDLLTIISSERTAGEIISMDEAIAGRIFEGSIYLSIGKDRGKNYRLKGEVLL